MKLHKLLLKLMAEQEHHQDKLQCLEAEDKLIVADQEAAALTHRVQGENEENEYKQREENAAGKRFVNDMTWVFGGAGINAARARLQVYDENESYPDQGLKPQNY